MNQEDINALKSVIIEKVKSEIISLGTFKSYEISEVRSVYIEDKYFEGLETPTVYSGESFYIEVILGSLGIMCIQNGNRKHSPNVSPSFVISGLSARYNHEEKAFDVIDWNELK